MMTLENTEMLFYQTEYTNSSPRGEEYRSFYIIIIMMITIIMQYNKEIPLIFYRKYHPISSHNKSTFIGL